MINLLLLVHATYIWVLFFAYILFVVNHTQCHAERLDPMDVRSVLLCCLVSVLQIPSV